MVKVEFVKAPTSNKKAKIGAKRVRIRDSNGKVRMVWTIDAHSSTLGADVQHAFARSVAKARRQNKKVVGSTDFAPAE